MTTVTKPEMTTAWGTTGSISTPTTAKQSQGWVSEIPPLEYFNWLDNRQDTYLQHIDQGGVPEWDATVSYVANYSYTKRNGVVYGCIVSNTGSDPSTTPSDWVAMPSPTTAGHLVTARNTLDDGSGNTTVASLTSTNGVTLGSSTDSVYLYDGGSNSFAVRVGPPTAFQFFTVRGSDGTVLVDGSGLPVLPATASNHAVQLGQLQNHGRAWTLMLWTGVSQWTATGPLTNQQMSLNVLSAPSELGITKIRLQLSIAVNTTVAGGTVTWSLAGFPEVSGSISTATAGWQNVDTGPVTLTSPLTNVIGHVTMTTSVATSVSNGDGQLMLY